MKPVERILAAAELKPVDQTPVIPVLLQQGARILGISLKDYYRDPRRLAEGQHALIDRFGHDAVFAVPHVVQDTMPWGAGLNFHDDGPPSVNKMIITDFADILTLPVPKAQDHPYLARTLDAARTLAQTFKGDRLIVGAVIGPFSLPSLLMGTAKFMRLLLSDEETKRKYYRPLMQKMLEYSTRWAQAQLQAGCDLVVVAEGIASATILAEKTFVAEAKPILGQFLSQAGGLIGLELVGDALPFLNHIAQLPAAAVLIGEKDSVGECRKKLGRSKALIGNVNNLKLLRWNHERVEFEARRIIAEAGPGFILANQGPEIPWFVPDENIDALVNAAHRQNGRVQLAA